MKPWIASLAAMSLAGCAAIGGGGPENRVTFNCDRGPPVTVVFSGNAARIVGSGGRDMVLQRHVTPAGVVYESPTRTIRRQGDRIVYTIGRTAPMTCIRAPQPR